MQTRIRYKTTGNLLVSTRTILVNNNAPVSVSIDTTVLTVTLTNLDTAEIIFTTTAKTVTALKLAAKTALKNLGVVFAPETRQRTKETEATFIETNDQDKVA